MRRALQQTARVVSTPLGLYTLAALLLTWPLITHLTTHVPGDGIDDPALAWNLWWIKERLVDQLNLDIFHSAWMFQPIGINLGFYTLTPLNGLLSVPLQSALSLLLANNLILLSSFVLGGFGAYLLVRQELGPRGSAAAALLAGFVYAFASSKLFYVSLGQFNIASSQWIPFCALYLLRLGRATSWRSGLRNAFLAGLFLTGQAWAELTYASFLLIFAALVFLWALIPTPAERADRLVRFVSFVVLGLLFLLGISPFLWAMLPDLLREGNFFASGGGFADQFSADLAGYLLPTRLHPLFGSWTDQVAFPHTLGQQIFIGYSGMLLAVGGSILLFRRAQRRWAYFWLCATFLFWWLTLGPQVRWQGVPTGFPGLFDLISQLPFFSGNRYPSRYSVMLMLGIAVLAGAGLQALITLSQQWGKQARRRVAMALTLSFVALFLVEHLSIPLPLSDFRVPPIYQRLAAEPGDFTVLELPTGWRNGARVLGKSDILIMMQQWYQTAHGKRRLGGNTSRNPAYKFQYFTNAPLLSDLIALMNAEPASTPANDAIAKVVEPELDAIIARNRPLAGEVLALLGVRYVTVHVNQATPALLRFVSEALPLHLVEEWQGRDWRGEASTIRLYRVEPAAASPATTIDLAAPSGALYLAEGWSSLTVAGFRYATRPCAELRLALPEQGGDLWLHVQGSPQTATLALNGQPLGALRIPTRGAGAALTVAAGQASALIDRLQLCFATPTPLRDLTTTRQAGGPIGTTGVVSAQNIVVQSAGYDVGDFAHIWVNGVDVSPNQSGYNLVALDAAGQVLGQGAFATHADPAQSQAMVTWLQQWPADTIMAGAVRDEGSYQLTEQAVSALKQLGVQTDLREHFRWSHAFLGVVGAPPASAVEATGLLQPATVHVGVGIDAPVFYGGISQVRFVAKPERTKSGEETTQHASPSIAD
ncbi:MAG: hypothetical protein KF832_31160 [Caldilineaceae bacterium]|nr:hypothetical protein [Caldilineaceae bacterium]